MIPLLIWYGIEPVVGADAEVGIQLAKVSKMPKVTEFIYRRLSAEPEGRNTLLRALAGLESATTAQPEKGGSQPSNGGGDPKKGPATPPKVLPEPGKKGADSAKGGSDPEKGAAHLPKVGGNIPKGGTHLPKVGGNIQKVGTHLPKVGGDIPKVGTHFSKVGGHIAKVGTHFLKVGGHLPKVGAHFLMVGAHLLVVNASFAAVKADSPAFSPEEKESILASVVGAARGAGRLAPPADWPAIAAGLRAHSSVAWPHWLSLALCTLPHAAESLASV
jgi:hypothetical protein